MKWNKKINYIKMWWCACYTRIKCLTTTKQQKKSLKELWKFMINYLKEIKSVCDNYS